MGLGKRKRRDQLKSSDELNGSRLEGGYADLHALFRQHFEARFRPLDSISLPVKEQQVTRPPSLGEGEMSDWEGLADEAQGGPEIVELNPSLASSDELPAEELKSFMGAKPPSTSALSTRKKQQLQTVDVEESLSDAANLKKDLELQRLLKESHLLESQSSLSVVGKNRHKALDLRLQDLGSKSSIYAQEKMPMAHRKGIAAKAAEKEEARRKEAQENGIILEKAVKTKRDRAGRREKALGIPSVGKFRGGMLKLSKKDVAQIQGPGTTTIKRRR